MQSPPGLHRVKLYKLNETGGWDDKGTGLVSVGPMEFANHQSNSVGLVVIGEETQKMLMVHRILHEDIYNRQDETIITWTDPDIGTDVALSFQEGQGCNAIWQHILRVQSDADPKHPDHRRRVIDEFDGAHHLVDGDYAQHDVGGEIGAAAGHVELPAAEMGNLEEIAKVLAHVPPMQRERVAQLLMGPGYLRKLLDLFRQCEDLEDLPSLQHMFRLMRSIIMLNDTQLLDELLKEEHVMDVMGCLEYDPDLQAPQQHRTFLQTAVVFKEVVPITSQVLFLCVPALYDLGDVLHTQEVLMKIHQTYRIQYLKDVILPRSLDDATYATLSSLMLFNNVDVVLGLYQDTNFLPRLFSALKSRQPGDSDWDDLVAFLQEFCSLAKHLQLQQRQNLWNKMTQLGMFEVITRILQSSSAFVKLRATDVLLSALAHDPLPLRSFLAGQAGHQLLDCLVTEFISSEQSGLAEQIAELLKLLVDPETMEGSLEKNDFMDVFYTNFMDKLIAPVSGEVPGGAAAAKGAKQAAASSKSSGGKAAVDSSTMSNAASSSSSSVPASTIGLIVDLLCFCVQHHQYFAKYHVLRKNVVEKVLSLLRRKERWLVVAGIRFLRTCVGTKDDFYMRHLIKNSLLDPVMAVFFENGERYNLLNSAVLELVEFIRKENIKALIEYLVEKFGNRFEEVTYVDTFKQLQLKWEQAKEMAAAAVGEGAAADSRAGGGRLYSSKRRFRRDDREMDKDEEDYFSEDSVEEDAQPAATAAGAADVAAASEPRLVIKGLFKQIGGAAAAGAAAGAGSTAAGGAAAGRGTGRAGSQSAAGAAGGVAAAEEGAGLLLNLVPYGDDEDEEQQQQQQQQPGTEPHSQAIKGLEGNQQQSARSLGTRSDHKDSNDKAPQQQQQQDGLKDQPCHGQHHNHQQQPVLKKHQQESMVGNGSPVPQQQQQSSGKVQQRRGQAVAGDKIVAAAQQQQQQQWSAGHGSPPQSAAAAAGAAALHESSSIPQSSPGSLDARQSQQPSAAAGQQLTPKASSVCGSPAAAAPAAAAPAAASVTPTKRGTKELSAAAAGAGASPSSPGSPGAKRLRAAAAGATGTTDQAQQHQQAPAPEPTGAGMDVPA